jgi:hypothetical protein
LGNGAASVGSRFALPFRISTTAGLVACAIMAAALILRILAARGELWLDELWSLKLIDEVEARHDLLWGLAVDNNHYLNTLYLYLVGSGAPVLVQRGLSILLGTATVLVAGVAMRRSGTAGMLCAMALFAFTYPMVNYGSEARGYAGLILMTLVAITLVERATAGSIGDRRKLGAVNLLGALFQPIMLGAIAGQMTWSAWISRPRARPTTGAILTVVGVTARTFSWTVRLLIPVTAIIAVAVLHADGYRIAGTVPFSAAGFVSGYGGMLRLSLGLPDAIPDWIALAVTVAALALGWRFVFRHDPNRAGLYFIFLVGMPLAMFIVRLPNILFPRYYLASAVVFLLLLSDLFAAAWSRGGAARLLGSALLAAILLGSGANALLLLRDGRDQSASVIRMVANSGPALVTSDQDARNQPIIEYFARRFNLPITYVATGEICARNPEWLLSSSVDRTMPEALDTSIVGCKRIFRKQAAFPQWGLSGLPWTVYRAAQ